MVNEIIVFADSSRQRLTINLANVRCVSALVGDALKFLRLSSIGVESIIVACVPPRSAIQYATRKYNHTRTMRESRRNADSDRIPRITPIISAIMHSMTKRECLRSCWISVRFLPLSSIMSKKHRMIRNGDTFRQPVQVSYQINSTRHDSLAMIYHMVCITHRRAVSAR